MPKEGDFSHDFVESELLNEIFMETIKSKNYYWFPVFGEQKLNKVIAVGKRGVSKFYVNLIKEFELEETAFLPSDKYLLGLVLKADEYTLPLSYEKIFKDSHGSKVSGYGEPALKSGESFNECRQNV